VKKIIDMNSIKDKNIIITGASKGLGAVCAKAFAEYNTKLVLIARTKFKLEKVRQSCQNTENHMILPIDLCNQEELHEGIISAKHFLKSVDILLHVAGGGLGMHNPLIEATDLFKLFKLNLGSIVEINRMIVPDMIKQGSGNIVHVGSIASTEATGSVGYNTVKAALAAYVRSFGNQMAGSGIIVNGILPGGFLAPENAMERLNKSKPEVYAHFVKERLPRQYMAKAEEMLPLLFFLCSNSASMMGGCMVPIDAGEGKAYQQI